MSGPIGILVDQAVLRRALRGGKTVERIHLYRTIARDELKIDIVLFSVEGVALARGRLRGYVPSGSGWRRVHSPIPKVIHKRVLYRTGAPLRTLARMRQRGVTFVNPHLIQNKERMNEILTSDERVRDHLPPTSAYRWERLAALLDEGVGAILKPRVGSVGQGLMRVRPLPDGRFELTGRARRTMSRAALRREIRRRIGSRRYLLQHYLNLARYQGRPFDLRVPVQRDGTGAWQVPGLVAKVAIKHAFLTNMAQGGRAIPGERAIEAAFPPSKAASVIESTRRLAVDVAEAVARVHPYAADLGLDIGVDQDGKPWLIEVNTRDQRYTFHEAGLSETFRALYRNPLAYCARLARLTDGRLDEA